MKRFNFISIQATFAQVSINLYKNGTCCAKFIQEDLKASSHLIPFIDNLLKEHALQLSDLDFIAADCGPGAFTSLRVSLATLNGIGFSTHRPLVGVDGLEALTLDTFRAVTNSPELPANYLIASILNAYNNDIYYALAEANAESFKILDKGVMPIDALLQHPILQNFSHVAWNGNALNSYQEAFSQRQKDFIQIQVPYLPVATAHSIGTLGLKEFTQNPTAVFTLQPNYIKTQAFAIKREFKQLKDF